MAVTGPAGLEKQTGAQVRAALEGSSQPLAPGLRTSMEQRFGQDFSQVRIHADPSAAESASAVNALAYTVGRDVVFGAGQYAPQNEDGRRLIAHELAHVVQQQAWAGKPGASITIAEENDPAEMEASRAAEKQPGVEKSDISRIHPAQIMRQRASAPTQTTAPPVPMPPTESFTQMWKRFEEYRDANKNAQAIQLAPALISVMMGEDAMNHAGDMAVWLLQQNQWQLARQALEVMETAWWLRFVTMGGPGVPWPEISMWGRQVGPEGLTQQAEQQASAGQHERARELFGYAYLLTQMQLITVSDKRFASLKELEKVDKRAEIDFPFFRVLSYSEEQSIIGRMRRILRYYPVLERQATASGDSVKAGEYQHLGEVLHQALRERFTLAGETEGTRAITLEATYGTDRRRGEGYRLHGVQGADEFVTPLPGEPLPDELGRHPAYTASMEELTRVIAGQEDFLTEIQRNPEIRKAYGKRAINMNDQNTRLTVWRIMFSAYQKQPAPGCPTALCSLLRLVERYLRNFTKHTGYNIRDFGVSYLDSTFPEDLAGRAVRDCGVYAVTVAYEIFRTARGATPRLPVGFQLYTTMEHTMLLILDQDANQHYVVSNDEITGPRSGDGAGTIAGVYSGVMKREQLITAAGRSKVLTSSQTDASFRGEIWQGFQSGAHIALDIGPRQAGDTRSDAQRNSDTYTQYYQAMERFDRAGSMAHSSLNNLLARLVKMNRSAQSTTMTSEISNLTRMGSGMAQIFQAFLAPGNVGLTPGATRPVERVVLTSAGPGQDVHPLLRIGKALMYYESLGNTLSQDQQQLLDWIRKAPLPSFPAGLNNYDAAGRPLDF